MKKKILIILSVLFIIGLITPFIINSYVKRAVNNRIIDSSYVSNIKNIDAILVLGCRAYEYGPSMMLQERLDKGIELYEKIDKTKLLLSGDHGQKEYDEVNTMRNYVLSNNTITSKDIFLDHAGFSTYDSIYRAKEIFKTKKIIIVTQEYHLYRALYIAKKLGLEAYGVSAKEIISGQFSRDFREVLARNKDFVKTIFKPKSSIMGNIIPITGDGNITVD